MHTSDLPRFTATLLRESQGVPIVSAFGEIDLACAHELDVILAEAVSQADEAGSVMVDLGGVEFMDVTGLRLLMKARQALREAVGEEGLLLVICGGQVRRLFEITGLAESFNLYPDLRTAAQESVKPALVNQIV